MLGSQKDGVLVSNSCLKRINQMVAHRNCLEDEMKRGIFRLLTFDDVYATEFTQFLFDWGLLSDNKLASLTMNQIEAFNEDFISEHIQQDVFNYEDFKQLCRSLLQSAPERAAQDGLAADSQSESAQEKMIMFVLAKKIASSIIDYDMNHICHDRLSVYVGTVIYHKSSSSYIFADGELSLGLTYSIKSFDDESYSEERNLAFATTRLFDENRVKDKNKAFFALDNLHYVLTEVASRDAMDSAVEQNLLLARNFVSDI